METESLIKVADIVNAKRRKEVLKIYRNSYVFDQIKNLRKSEVFDKGKEKGAKLKKIATVPVEVDAFFQKLYGVDYYKDPDFFTKAHPEWRVVDKNQFGIEDDNIRSISQGFRND